MNSENPYARAAAVLQGLAWVEGTPEPFPLGSAFDPQAAESWGLCVDAVAALPDEGGPLGVASRLKLRFSGTHSAAAGEVNGRVIWRWEGCPREPWVTSAEIAALQQAAAAWDFLNSRESSGDDSREAVRVRRLAEWLQAIAAIDPLRLESLQLLQRAAAVVWNFERSAADELSTGEINAAAELSRALRPKIHQAAAALGFTAGDQADLFAADYSRRANAWGALQAAAANRAAAAPAAAAPEPASGGPEPVAAAAAALSADHSPVNAKQLAAHAGCTDRMIRRYLADCPAETVRSGAKIWRYGAVLAKLRQWREDKRQKRLQAVVWPDLAKNLKNKAAGTKKK